MTKLYCEHECAKHVAAVAVSFPGLVRLQVPCFVEASVARAAAGPAKEVASCDLSTQMQHVPHAGSLQVQAGMREMRKIRPAKGPRHPAKNTRAVAVAAAVTRVKARAATSRSQTRHNRGVCGVEAACAA